MKFGTSLIHDGSGPDQSTGAVTPPIYQTSTFHQTNLDSPGKYDYSRSGNPTREALENAIAKLEGGHRGFAFASGMAAISSVLALFSQGDHIVICEDVYGGTYRAASRLFPRFGIDFTFVDATISENLERSIRKNTKALFLETPSNPLLRITDLAGAICIAKAHGLLVIVDNTFMTPYLQQPLALGADIVVHSATKFIAGHSDVVAGLVVVKDAALADELYFVQNGFGAILGPQDSWLTLRGLKTLQVRLDRSQDTASKLALWLKGQSNVVAVHYPTLDGHVGKALHMSQACGGGAVLSFETDTKDNARQFLDQVRCCAVAVSLGGVETIVSYPVSMSHASMPEVQRTRLGISDRLIRVSVGLEELEDLQQDFIQALCYNR